MSPTGSANVVRWCRPQNPQVLLFHRLCWPFDGCSKRRCYVYCTFAPETVRTDACMSNETRWILLSYALHGGFKNQHTKKQQGFEKIYSTMTVQWLKYDQVRFKSSFILRARWLLRQPNGLIKASWYLLNCAQLLTDGLLLLLLF